MADQRSNMNTPDRCPHTRALFIAAIVAPLAIGACGNDSSQSANGTGPTKAPTNSTPSQSTSQPPSGTALVPGSEPAAARDLVRTVIADEVFELEPALNNATRYRGLGGRDSLPERGGMVFAFPFSERLEFVMRDCLMDIDIAYLDNDGTVLMMHTMTMEPRAEGESDAAYEAGLARYPSRFPARFAVEVRGGLLRELGLEVGDVIEFDREALKARAR